MTKRVVAECYTNLHLLSHGGVGGSTMAAAERSPMVGVRHRLVPTFGGISG